MYRFFLEVSYEGTAYSGFQVQDNAVTVQSEVERALGILLKKKISCTGSSRTDAGVHALQNFFHFDFDAEIPNGIIYHINAVLPATICVSRLLKMPDGAHCRFHATSRVYHYQLHNRKDPFLINRSWYYPFPLNESILHQCSSIIKNTLDFTSFAKRNTDVKTHMCHIVLSEWRQSVSGWTYQVEANRFLRGMVKGLVSTMLLAGREKLSIVQFEDIIAGRNNGRAVFTAPGHGLYLQKVSFPPGYFDPAVPVFN